MERLTEKITNMETKEVLAYRLKSRRDEIKAWRKLGEYEDLEEQGLLIRKTFELGGKAYIHQFNEEDVLVPVQGSVVDIGEDFVRILIHDGRQLDIPKNSKGIFLSEQEAEAALAEMQKG